MACQLVDLTRRHTEAGGDVWAEYRPAIDRWAAVVGWDVPEPTVVGRNSPRANPTFVEWAMGLPAGWLTDPVFGLSHTRLMRALGNGVVPQQATLALTLLRHYADSNHS